MKYHHKYEFYEHQEIPESLFPDISSLPKKPPEENEPIKCLGVYHPNEKVYAYDKVSALPIDLVYLNEVIAPPALVYFNKDF
jgi:hypothetical protein